MKCFKAIVVLLMLNVAAKAMIIRPPGGGAENKKVEQEQKREPNKEEFSRRGNIMPSRRQGRRAEKPIGAHVVKHKIEKGDSLAKISGIYYGTQAYAERLGLFNKMPPAKPLRIGRLILVPPLDMLLMSTPSEEGVRNQALFINLFPGAKFDLGKAFGVLIRSASELGGLLKMVPAGAPRQRLDKAGVISELSGFDFDSKNLLLLFFPAHPKAGIAQPYIIKYPKKNKPEVETIHLELESRAKDINGRALFLEKKTAFKVLFHRRGKEYEIPIKNKLSPGKSLK